MQYPGFFDDQIFLYLLCVFVVLITYANLYNRADYLNQPSNIQSLNIPLRASTTYFRYLLGLICYLTCILALFNLLYLIPNFINSLYQILPNSHGNSGYLVESANLSADIRIIASSLMLLVTPNVPMFSRYNQIVLRKCHFQIALIPMQLQAFAHQLDVFSGEFNQEHVVAVIHDARANGIDLREEDFSAPADSIYFLSAKMSYLYYVIQDMKKFRNYSRYMQNQWDTFREIEHEFIKNQRRIADSREILDIVIDDMDNRSKKLFESYKYRVREESDKLDVFSKKLTRLLCSMLLYCHRLEKDRDLVIRNIWINWKTDNKTIQNKTVVFKKCIKFLNGGQNRVKQEGGTNLFLSDAPGRLKSFTPITVMVSENVLTGEHINTIVERAKKISESEKEKAGIMIYKVAPDTRIRMRIAEARLTDHVHIIPIPYANIELASGDSDAYDGILLEFAERYMPGANLFDDRNAIGDTMSFFGRTDLLLKLFEDLVRLQSIGLFGLRKSGKTSIILQLAYFAKEHPVVHIDLQRYEGHKFFGAEVFSDIIYRLNKIVSERDLSIQTLLTVNEEKSASHYTQEFTQKFNILSDRLKEMGYELPVLCFFDEMERVIPQATDSSDKALDFNTLFGTLRGLSQNERKLAIMVVDLHADCNRINHWPQERVSTNPIYSFFKETYVTPFNLEDTCRMIEDIGKLMGRNFDEQTKKMIHQESGGIPFLSRQLASTLYQKIEPSNGIHIIWTEAKRIIDKSAKYSSIIRDYFKQSVWGDLEKRNRLAEMAILRVLAVNAKLEQYLSETTITSKLNNRFTQSQILEGLTWLESNGLTKSKMQDGEDHYSIHPFLFTKWLLSHMTQKERVKWQI